MISPNVQVRPASAAVNEEGHLTIGGCDTVDLANEYGTPLWVVDEDTIRLAAQACVEGLKGYPNSQVLYAGKAFLCTAMCRLIKSMNLGLDVVSEGELHTAIKAGFPAEKTYLHGNNKSAKEVETALRLGVNIVIDSRSDAEMVASLARDLQLVGKVMIRVTPGVEPDTHAHIRTGQHDSKFGVPLDAVAPLAQWITDQNDALHLIGIHAHIGSQGKELGPYLEIVDIFADLLQTLKNEHQISISTLDLGGGLGIAYTDQDKPAALYDWAKALADRMKKAFDQRSLALPTLMIEPGRSIIGTAGVTLYTAGHSKTMGNQTNYLALDGGMADNPRPITYQAQYTAALANRMNAPLSANPLTLAGRYCESGDIIIREAYLPAKTGDLVAIFATGAYNYSMASNYNRTPRPACVLVKDGQADLIIERETLDDLIRQDRIPRRLLDESL